MKKVTLGLGLALVLALTLTITALAAPITVQGTVTAVDEVGGTFTVTLADASVYVVTPPAGFDWTTLAVGDVVQVSGEDDGLGNIAATGVSESSMVAGVVQSIDYTTCTFTILTSEGTTLTVTAPEGTDCSGILLGTNVELTGFLNPDGTFTVTGVVLTPTPSEEGVNTGFYCSNPGVPHPALSRVAAEHLTDYGTALNWFCGGGLGVGGVNKVLELSEASGKTPDEIRAMRETMGWGQIKKLLAQGEPVVVEETIETTIESVGPGNGHGNNGGGHGGGKPPWAGGGGNGNGKNK